MDTLTHVVDVLNRISATSSTSEKKKILKESKSDLLARIFKLTYDPFANYGVVKVDLSDVQYGHSSFDFDKFFDDLDKLQKREITGNAARDLIKSHLHGRPEIAADLVMKILKGDLRLGAGKTLIQSAYPGLFPANFCMLAGKFDDKHAKYPAYVDTKLDGARCIAVREGEIKLFSRSGKEFNNYKFIEEEIAQLGLPTEIKLDGEVMSGHFQDLMKTLHRKDGGIELAKDAVYNIFDVMVEGMELRYRIPILESISREIKDKGLTHLNVNFGILVNDRDELMLYYNSIISKGFEGVMVKDPNAHYEFDRSRAWMKLKPEETEDLRVVGYENGTGKYENVLGALVCDLGNGSTVSVGTGYSDDDRARFWEQRDNLIGQTAEIKFQEKTKDGSLRFPVFIGFRHDK